MQQNSSNKCQDCGNQAKRECSYARCRTCCKNKGFQCPTHIKSTWIPVERRRHREEEQDHHPHHDHSHQFQASDIPKKHKQHTTCSGSEELKFPAATSSVAVFRCVEVRSVDDAVNEIAYQTSVNIGGHVFSGLLYDQGPHQQSFSSSSGHLPDDHQHQNLSLINNNANPNSIHTTHSHHQDGAKMAPFISATSNFAHDQPNLLVTPPPPPYHQFPLAPFRPGMPYFSHPKP